MLEGLGDKGSISVCSDSTDDFESSLELVLNFFPFVKL